MRGAVRHEEDLLGKVALPADTLYGINTYRAMQNFGSMTQNLSHQRELVKALAVIKTACCKANLDFGRLTLNQSDAITKACNELYKGDLDNFLVVDMMEGSGGTSLNMNINEVIANRALVLMDYAPGRYEYCHPNDHVNISQSTNDVMPSAINIACYWALGHLLNNLDQLHEAFQRKSSGFADVLRLGRTCLQDAQPMTLGQTFGGYATVVNRCRHYIALLREDLRTLPLGGTAIGTGLGAPKGFRRQALKYLRTITSTEWSKPGDAFDAMQNPDGYLRLSNALRTCTLSLSKIAQDLILLSSGPSGGIGEITLPALQGGSSIMPGKVNPVLPMMMVQVACYVTGNDATIAMACDHGQCEINPYEPIIALKLFESIRTLTDALPRFSDLCVNGISANRDRMQHNLLQSSALATAFIPQLGYERVSQLVHQAEEEGLTFISLLARSEMLDEHSVINLIQSTIR